MTTSQNAGSSGGVRRRRLLAAFGLGGAVTAAVGVPRVLETTARDDTTARRDRLDTGTLHLSGADLRVSTGAGPGELPAGRAVPSTTGRLVGDDGSDQGVFRSSPLHLGAGAATLHTFDLADGTILGMGSGPLSEATFAIVGGTGRYAGATGAYVASLSPKGAGGDGTGEFTMDLRAGS